MSGLQLRNGAEDSTSAVDVREQGNSLRVAANTPHLVSLGCGRLSTAVTIHPIKQGRVTIGTDVHSDILLQGTGVQSEHCRIENSNGVVTLYPVNGVTIVDGLMVDQPVRLSQGCMIGIGRSNYLRFNHPAEANLMKSVLPNTRISMAPMQFLPGDNNYQQQVEVNNQPLYNNEHHRNNDPRMNGQATMAATNEITQNGQYYQQNDNNYSQNDGHQNLEKELDMTYKELSKRKPPVAPRKMLREYDQMSNSSNSDQEALMNQRANTPPKSGGIMSKVSKFEYYVRNSQKNSKSSSPQNNEGGEMFSPKVFSSNSLTVNTPAKDVLGKEIPSNFVQNKNQMQNVANGDYRNLRKIVLNDNNIVDPRNCSYTNVTMKNPVSKIEHIAKTYADPYYSDVPDDVTPCSITNGHTPKAGFKLKPPSATFNRNPVFSSSNSANCRIASSPPNTHSHTSEAEAQRRQAHIARMDDESQKFLEQARLEEILNICAEYEKQATQGVPTTTTEKRPPNKIITNGSLPRGLQNSPNIVQSSDGYFRFDPGHNRSDYSPIRNQPPSPQSPLVTQNRHHKPDLPNYENVKIFTQNNMPTISNGQYTQMNRINQITMSPVDSKSIQFSSHHSSYENFNLESQTMTVHRQENHVQNARQFPITELSSPVMIRKIARNAQNSSNYAGSYDRNPQNGDMGSPRVTENNPMLFSVSNSTLSPYENMVIQSRNVNANVSPYLNVTPKSPSSHSPRTRIKTTYTHQNQSNPQHFIFPSPPPIEQLENYQLDASLKALSIASNELSNQCNAKCSGIEKQLSLTEDIPMIDDTNFANELEMRIARLKPENRNHSEEPAEEEALLDPDNVFGGNRRNFEDIRRDLIADIPELDEIHRDIDRDLLQAVTPSDTKKSVNTNNKSSTNEYLQEMSQKLRDVPLIDEVFCENGAREDVSRDSCVSQLQTPVQVKLIKVEEERKSLEDNVSTLEILRCKRKKVLAEIHTVKCKMSDIRSQEDDILRELELEKALLQGEYESEMAILKLEQQRLTGLRCDAQTFEGQMSDQKSEQEARHETANQRLQEAAKGVNKMEKDFSRHVATLEELRNAQESLENERKTFEDMEFQDLEEEAENLAHREELQNEITALTQKIDAQKSRILNLRIETSNNLNSAVEETKVLQADYVSMLNIIEKLTTDLQAIEMDIKTAVTEIGVDYREADSKRNSSMEERRSRIKSGDFSPPSSDNEDVNEFECFENRKKTLKDRLVSIDQMSRSMIVDLGEKRSIEDLITSDQDRSLQSIENSPNKVIRESTSNESSPMRNSDQIFLQNESSPAEIETFSQKRCNKSVSSEESREKSPIKTDSGSDLSPDKEKKQGFWERNFDSLSRLKGKDKRSKSHTKSQDIMSQSLNENMFFNNDNIESEYGSFEKCNSLRSSKKNKDISQSSKSGEKSSKIPSLATLGKMIRRDSVGKKNKEDKSVKSSNEVISNKENIDLNASNNSDERDSFKSEGSPDEEQKNIKHRYVKNARSSVSDNKYLSKCTKTNQQSISISPDRNNSNIIDDFRRMSGNSYNGDARDSYADSLEEEVRIIDPTTGNTVRLCEITKSSDVKKISYRKSAGDEGRRFSGDIFSGLCENTKVPSQDDIDRMSKVTLDAPILSKTGEMNSLGRRTLDSLREIERNRMAMLEQKGCQVMEDEREKISELKRRVQTETKLKWEEDQQRTARNEAAIQQLDTERVEQERDSKNLERSTLHKIDEDDGTGERETRDISQDVMNSTLGNEAESSSIFGDSTQDSTSLEKQLRHSQTDSYNSSGGGIEENRVPPVCHLPPATPNSRPLSQLSDMSSDNGVSPYLMEGHKRSRKVSGSSLGPRPREDSQRPLTRYLPIDTDDLNLRMHIETAGHQVDLCPHIQLDFVSCRGYLHKLGAKFHGWSKRWFVFDRSNKTFIYYSDKNEKKPRGGAYFQVIEEVYLDHLNVSKSPTPLTTFVVKTRQRIYYLTAPSGPAARIWIDVIFTGAQGYTEYMH